MKLPKLKLLFVFIITLNVLPGGCTESQQEVERPEKIYSKRQVIYDTETYVKLADLWKKYYDVFPSEDAYANWMYATRYASLPDYENLLLKGFDKYPSNPTILYLTSMLRHGSTDNLEALHMLEKAAGLDPSYTDPLFSLIMYYMEMNENEKLDHTLRKILETGIISDEIIDYSYNMIAGIEKDAILITNGDNDTYPGWILNRIVKYRLDVKIVNRSMLNTEWYPGYLINSGLPNFLGGIKIEDFRNGIMDEIKSGRMKMPDTGPFSDSLIIKLVKAAERERVPVYFAATLYYSEGIKKYWENGIQFGLVTLVTKPGESFYNQFNRVIDSWLNDFKTGGIDSWKMQFADKGDAGRRLLMNYPAGISELLNNIKEYAPGKILPLFNWYREHIESLIPIEERTDLIKKWCEFKDISEIKKWCDKMGYE